jgi:hypothetical protein
LVKLKLFTAANGEASAIAEIDRTAACIEFARVQVLHGSEVDMVAALGQLEEAKDRGASLHHLANDPDFTALWNNPEFKKLVGKD